jgi:hypothetical protein
LILKDYLVLYLEDFALHPSLTLPIKQIMFVAARFASSWNTVLSPMTGHVQQHFDTHCLLLAICQVSIPNGKSLQFLLVQLWHLVRVDRNKFVLADQPRRQKIKSNAVYLLVPVSHISGAPFTSFSLDPKEAEPAVTLRIGFTPVKIESLGNGGFHLGHSTGCVEIDITSDSVTPMHDEGTIIHAPLRCFDKIEMMCSSRPCGVDVCIWVED